MKPVGTERDQEPDARDGRRQDQRQLDERDRDRAAAKASRREEIGRGRADQDDHAERDHRGDQAEPKRVRVLSSPSASDQLGRARLQEDRRDRDRQEDERQRERAGQDRGKPAQAQLLALRLEELGVEEQLVRLRRRAGRR